MSFCGSLYMVLVMISGGLEEFFRGSLWAKWGPKYHRDVERWASMVLVMISGGFLGGLEGSSEALLVGLGDYYKIILVLLLLPPSSINFISLRI